MSKELNLKLPLFGTINSFYSPYQYHGKTKNDEYILEDNDGDISLFDDLEDFKNEDVSENEKSKAVLLQCIVPYYNEDGTISRNKFTIDPSFNYSQIIDVLYSHYIYEKQERQNTKDILKEIMTAIYKQPIQALLNLSEKIEDCILKE